ncbi:MAG: hypothetical protein LBN93_10270 [Candidatus Symbiothrix sp.]|jgi:hypothetical protein|nr:hypothetical protein [Candidatus Symbiothrix sp.]
MLIINKISSTQYVALFIASVLIPSFLTWGLGEGGIFFGHYWLSILFGYLTAMSNKKFMYVLFSYFLLSIFFFHSATFGERTFYSVSFLFTSACLYGLNDLKIDLEEFNSRQILTVFIIFVLCYLVSIDSHSGGESERTYYHGFIIAHHYAYIAAFFGYFFIRQEKTLLGIAIVLSGTLVGTRSGLLVSAMPLIYAAKKYFTEMEGAKIQKIIWISVLCLVGLAAVGYLFQEQIAPTINTFQTLSVETIAENDEEEMGKVSASRTIFWALMFTQIAEDGFTLPNLIGRGPAASLDFLEKNFDARIWMHNDFFDIFFCFGLLGLCVYIFCICCYYRQTRDIYFLFMLLLAAFTNGFCTYMAVQFIALHLLSLKARVKIQMKNLQ